ncbi:MAG TPA: hypothetical protein VFS90_05040 [Pyrinomonadaceae bacterium]|nr:hypothetical protein [Pyrinomonadaceae bacterium]
MQTYTARIIEKVGQGPGYWETLRVGVFKSDGNHEEQVGEYSRDYPNLLNTFFHCTYGGKDYALYSPQYTVTRIMELPSCRDLGGEEPHSAGFCPVDFYVPRYIDREYTNPEGETVRYRVNDPGPEYLESRVKKLYRRDEKTGQGKFVETPDEPIGPLLYYPFGFVAGCIWGDDSSWKIQFLDLSQIQNGVIKGDARFGYIEMPDGMRLKEAINMGDFRYDLTDEISYIKIVTQRRFDLMSGKVIDEDIS